MGDWAYSGPINGKINAITVASKPSWNNGFVSAAQIGYYSDKNFGCIDMCEWSLSFMFKGEKGCLSTGFKWLNDRQNFNLVFKKGHKSHKARM